MREDLPACTSMPPPERLADVDLARVPVVLAAGARGAAAAWHLLALAAARGTPAEALRGAIGCDPIGGLAVDGAIAWPIEHCLADMSKVTDALAGTALRSALVDSGGYHEAGATAGDQLAAVLATGVAYLRALTAGGRAVEEAADRLQIAVAVGRDFFCEIAKLRAARLCWARVLAASCGAAPRPMLLHARGSWRERTIVNPWTGLLRGTGETFAAAIGGADTIATTAMVAAIGEPGELGRRMAINSGLIIAEESRLAHVEGDFFTNFKVKKISINDEKGPCIDGQNLEIAWSPIELFLRKIHVENAKFGYLKIYRKPQIKKSGKKLNFTIEIDKLIALIETKEKVSVKSGIFGAALNLNINRNHNIEASGALISAKRRNDRIIFAITAIEKKPLLIKIDANEANGGPIAGLLGLPNQSFSIFGNINASYKYGVLDISGQSANQNLIIINGNWNEIAGKIDGNANLAHKIQIFSSKFRNEKPNGL